MPGCPIQVSTDQFVCANPRSFSQLITPFFASESLGIPHTPLFCLCAAYLFIKINRTYNNSDKSELLCFLFLIIFLSQYVNELLSDLIGIVENNGVEPLTSCVQGRRSSQLS